MTRTPRVLRFEMTYLDAAAVVEALEHSRPDLASRLRDQLQACVASSDRLDSLLADIEARRKAKIRR